MRNMYKQCCTWKLWAMLLAIFLLHQAPGYAQSNQVTGVVTTDKNEPVMGVTIRVKGTNVGTATTADGRYTIQAKKGNVLVVSFIGYASQEVLVANSNTIDIKLVEANANLEELVVVAFGVQKKKVVTGATVKVNAGDLQKNHALSMEQALQGQAAGVQITSNSGQPGDALKFSIRGVGTNGNSNPLFIVDGIAVDDISYLNPNDIASIDVLKDAASTAIYGARAANGLVMITTHKGKSGKMQVSLDAYYGWANPYKKLDVLNAKEYAIIMNEAAINSGKAPFYSYEQIQQMGKGTDWQEAATRKNAPIQAYTLGVMGGNDVSTYSSAISYQGQEGVIGLEDQSYFNRTSFRFNSEHKLYKDRVRFGQNLTYTHAQSNGIGTGNIYNNSIRGLLNASPTFPVKNEDGTWGTSALSAEELNPIGIMYYTNMSKNISDRIVGNLYLDAQVVKGLRFRTDFGLDVGMNSTNNFVPKYQLTTNNKNAVDYASQGLYRNTTWNWDNYFTYQKNFGHHDLSVMVGMTARNTQGFNVSGTKEDLLVKDFYHGVINNGQNNNTQKTYGTRSEYALSSYFGRLTYSYKEKYLLNATLRRDGSVKFGANNRYGTFPALSAGWIVTNESFDKPSWLNFLKIRGGWGQNGNDRIVSDAYLATVSSQYRGYYFGGDTRAVGISPDYIPNPNVKWEASEQTNIGFDLILFKDVELGFDWYNKTTRDWLVQAPIPAIVGTGAPYINGGNIVNKGVEITANYHHNFGELSINIGGNIAFNKNKVNAIPNQEGVIHPAYGNILSSNMDEYYRAQNGFPIGYFYGLKTNGIFQNQAEIDNYKNDKGTVIQPGAKPGDVRFQDLNGDGVINGDDKTFLGDPNPSHTYGINLSAHYKGFDFSLLLSGVGGNQVVNGSRAYDRFYNNYTTQIFERWTGEGTSNRIPRVTMGDEANGNYTKFSDLYVSNGAFMRLKSLNIGYDFKKTIAKRLPVEQLRLYVSGLNLYTFTHYKGMDPEAGFGVDAWSSGTDLGYYPMPRTIMVGLNVKF
ncbi:TonB-linked SusC/RagA family outer membrane protein [Chitinophaga skermanii]|uniref:TonB-linked SusC/RagA family outer membrane protein n=1 Tax=Chitinophaga skermanii TaxID=331697 RepID=A0A327Q794_9BACT|nr:TonB-dependent receptor [Chitinophaga skermanii]RAI99834.1 TonB-linked SusC/RagA family outer membrane protein [Chitinophaga skermanii]